MNLTYSYTGCSFGSIVPRSMWQQNSNWFFAENKLIIKLQKKNTNKSGPNFWGPEIYTMGPWWRLRDSCNILYDGKWGPWHANDEESHKDTHGKKLQYLLFRYSGVCVSPSSMWEDKALYTSECSPTGRKFNRFWSTRSDWNIHKEDFNPTGPIEGWSYLNNACQTVAICKTHIWVLLPSIQWNFRVTVNCIMKETGCHGVSWMTTFYWVT